VAISIPTSHNAGSGSPQAFLVASADDIVPGPRGLVTDSNWGVGGAPLVLASTGSRIQVPSTVYSSRMIENRPNLTKTDRCCCARNLLLSSTCRARMGFCRFHILGIRWSQVRRVYPNVQCRPLRLTSLGPQVTERVLAGSGVGVMASSGPSSSRI
jgi:hypothetical protein